MLPQQLEESSKTLPFGQPSRVLLLSLSGFLFRRCFWMV